jgi:DNA-binding HxlR family transcriptional regulator
MLSKELKTMESQLLINKLKKSKFSIEMEYGLTDHGKSLQSLIENLIHWGDEHRDLIIDRWREESKV